MDVDYQKKNLFDNYIQYGTKVTKLNRQRKQFFDFYLVKSVIFSYQVEKNISNTAYHIKTDYFT